MSAASLDQRFAEAMGQLLGPDFPEHLALAVSGGGDSMAMLALAHNWAHVWGPKLWVVTVEHGLRPDSAEEAAMVARVCAALGWPHATLRWRWDGLGNLQEAAREGRLRMIGRWRGILAHVLMAHTQDDLAETFLMRLARGSGVDGLSAMTARREVWMTDAMPLAEGEYVGALPPQSGDRPGSFTVCRPCLGMPREALRHYARTVRMPWVDDPSNDDPRFDRVKVRQARATLDGLGLDAATLAATAVRLARARQALRARAAQVWSEIGQEGRCGAVPTGELLFTRDGFERTERDTQLRLLAAALQWVASAAFRPRAEPLDALLDRLLGGGGGTLHGCEARMERDRLRVFREWKAVADGETPLEPGKASGALWDGRWQVAGTGRPRETVRALGEDGWAQTGARPADAPPFHSARSLPSLWAGDTLLACPALGFGDTLELQLRPMGREANPFSSFLLSH